MASTIISCGTIVGQELEFAQISDTELSKAAQKEGTYAGTFVNNGAVDVLYVTNSKKEGKKIDHYSFNENLTLDKLFNNDFDKEVSEKDYAWYIPKKKVETLSPTGSKWLKTGRTFGGGMKFWMGTMKKNYRLGIFTDMTFEEEKELKVKTGDVWRLYTSGYKSTTNFDAVEATSGFSYQLKTYGENILVPANEPFIAAGVIQEKVKIGKPTLYAANRIAVMSVSGEKFENPDYNIYIHPYSAMTMATGLGQDNNLCCVFAPLNAPTKGVGGSLDYLYWKDKKDVFSMYRFSDEYELIDSVSFKSKLLWGHFEVARGHAEGASFIIGNGKEDFDGWPRNAGIQVKKVDCFQFTKIKDGKENYTIMIKADDLENRMIGPKGEKVKLELPPNKIKTEEVVPLTNGDDLIIMRSPFSTLLFQLSSKGELKAFYNIPAVSSKDNKVYNHQAVIKGDNLFLVLNEQPHEFTNETQVNTESTTVKGAYVTTTYTTTTVKRLNQVFLVSQLVRINTNDLSVSNTLKMNDKSFYTMGSYPAYITQDAIYFTGNDKGPGGKKLYIARVDL